MNKKLINWIGLLGIGALISYAVAAYFCRAAFPGYNWMESAVSDLSARTAPSSALWDKLSAVFAVGIVCDTCVAIYVAEKKISTKLFRVGIYMFVIKSWISKIGYTMFPLDDAGKEKNEAANITTSYDAIVESNYKSDVITEINMKDPDADQCKNLYK